MDSSSQSDNEISRSLVMLFRLFTLNYKALWTDNLQEPAMRKANNFLWNECFKGYPEQIITEAGMQAVKTYHYPPSIQQFLEIVRAISRHERMENASKQRLLGNDGQHRSPHVSPLLAEYMRKNGA